MNLYLRMLLLMLRARRAPELGLWDTAMTPFRVVPSDLDPLLHMNNGKYLSLMDLGRLDLMLRSGFWDKLTARGWYPVVAAQTITYKRSLGPGRRFVLWTRILGIDERSVYLEQTFRIGDTVYASAVVRARLLKRSGGAVSYAELEELSGGFPDHLEVPAWVRRWAEDTRISGSGFVGSPSDSGSSDSDGDPSPVTHAVNLDSSDPGSSAPDGSDSPAAHHV
jgi:acyl-CoA thioesterase FadM